MHWNAHHSGTMGVGWVGRSRLGIGWVGVGGRVCGRGGRAIGIGLWVRGGGPWGVGGPLGRGPLLLGGWGSGGGGGWEGALGVVDGAGGL